ncbi:hypothetical protein HXX76_009705 [Chlamydomonas incerta]|uniref:Uncharacterized protein n=1 Tax=Chlamydomonas incerta TaxID=51695 RepID=A0A835STG8_CHLIN|nr:hypothetical protein HXX76_009705 [Chlamydomonas incerta]|eukprot:KAG2431177.1 hypothetical protein HXX76_009705 [Chlamydomonas incerta]
MPTPAVKGILAAKAGGKPSGSKAVTTSTPAWKAKLQARTPTSKGPAAVDGGDRASTAEPEPTNAGRESASTRSEQQALDVAAAALKLTFIAPVPLLPKPELTRPQAPTDRSALLRQLQDLRSAGSRMLQEQQQQQQHQQQQQQQQHDSAALTAAAAGGFGAAASFLAPGRGHSHPQQHPQQLQAPASPLAGSLAGAPRSPLTAPRTPGTGARPALSPPSLAGLRLQEAADTGGGFLTHFADPQDLTTTPEHGAGGASRSRMGTPGGGRGGAGASHRGIMGASGGVGGRLSFGAGGTPATAGGGMAAGGCSTPLSALRTVEKVQQLQRRLASLQQEGASLVAGMGDD